MKNFFILVLAVAFLSGCRVLMPERKCQPSKGSKDWAIVVRIQKEELVTYVRARHYRYQYHIFFKCLPDSIKVGSRVDVTGWERI